MAGTIRKTSLIRRSFPGILLAAALAAFGGACSRPLRIAAIVTTFFPNSHAGVIVGKFLRTN